MHLAREELQTSMLNARGELQGKRNRRRTGKEVNRRGTLGYVRGTFLDLFGL